MTEESITQLVRDVGLPGVLVLYFVRWLTGSLDKKLNALFRRTNDSIDLQGKQADTIEAMGRQLEETNTRLETIERTMAEGGTRRRLPSRGERE